MQESEKRALRTRRVPKCQNSDEQDREVSGRPRSYSTKEPKQSTLSLSVMSKLLVKFITKTNLQYKERQRELKKQKKDKEKKMETQSAQTSLKNHNQAQNNKKYINPLKQSSRDLNQNHKNLYSFKSSLQIKQQKSFPQSACAYQNHFIGNLPYPIYDKNSFYNLMAQAQFSNHKSISLINKSKQRNHSQWNTGNIYQQNDGDQRTQSAPFSRKKYDKNALRRPQQTITEDKKKNQMKLFKRASFHVAIAYHIYFQNMKPANQSILGKQDYDPTRHAKRLKQSKCKTTEPQQNI